MMDAAVLRLNRAAFEQWLQGEGGDNRAELDRLKRALPVVLDPVPHGADRTGPGGRGGGTIGRIGKKKAAP